eukprot:NODE_18526_length_888_cov_5.427070.p1 GENE.NODE_18526_length_888_cov_5.427070~~NODE_18526_length_888_cov_5.427070.p1  ORF type:complete len:141 (+),score=16.65 NODE_18526_length_888_cov_5.427070:133-555(+)
MGSELAVCTGVLPCIAHSIEALPCGGDQEADVMNKQVNSKIWGEEDASRPVRRGSDADSSSSGGEKSNHAVLNPWDILRNSPRLKCTRSSSSDSSSSSVPPSSPAPPASLAAPQPRRRASASSAPGGTTWDYAAIFNEAS